VDDWRTAALWLALLVIWALAVCAALGALLAPAAFPVAPVYGIRGRAMNYGDLKAEVAAYLHRGDLTATIPGFIEKGRVRIGRDLRSLEQETSATLTGPVDSVFTLPTDFAELLRIESGGVPLRSVNPHEISFWEALSSAQVYCIRNRTITIPGAAEVLIWYFAIEPALTLDATEHATMLRHPQVWLAAAMLEAALYTADAELLTTWSDVYASEVRAVNVRAKRSREGTAPAVVASNSDVSFFEARN
jgi:hypothetical protein